MSKRAKVLYLCLLLPSLLFHSLHPLFGFPPLFDDPSKPGLTQEDLEFTEDDDGEEDIIPKVSIPVAPVQVVSPILSNQLGYAMIDI